MVERGSWMHVTAMAERGGMSEVVNESIESVS